MFPVPGWNLSAPLKKQTKIFSEPSRAAESDQTNGEDAVPLSKKRKRNSGKSRVLEATAENVAELWQKHIIGDGKSAPPSKAENGEPAQKTDSSVGKGPEKKQKKRKSSGQEELARNGDASVIQDAVAGAEKPAELATPSGSKREKPKPMKQKRDSDISPPSPNSPPVKDASKRPEKPPKNPAIPVPIPAPAGLTPLQASMRAKLSAARFRHLNETLYTTPSTSALQLFSTSSDVFEDYHAGFRQQVAVWPENPVDTFVGMIKERGVVRDVSQKGMFKRHKRGKKDAPGADGAVGSKGKDGIRPLPRTMGHCTIADLGCGDAKLAATLQPQLEKLHLKIHSLDLHSASPLVTKADIAHVPLPDRTLDVAIFCLALMGTNWPDFIDEAYRLLRWKGELWIAEIKSRFGRVDGKKRGGPVEHATGKKKQKAEEHTSKRRQREQEERENEEVAAIVVDGIEKRQETDVSGFVEVLARRGFVLDGESAVDLGNKMFVRMQFVKAADPVKGKKGLSSQAEKFAKSKWMVDEEDEDEAKVLKPCVYKLR